MSHNPCRWIINGSLWTLPYELICYLGLAGVAAVGILRRMRSVMFLVFMVSWAMYGLSWCSPSLFHEYFPQRPMTMLAMLCLYFSSGSVCYLYRERIRFSGGLVLVAFPLCAASLATDWFGIVGPVALPYVFFWLACKLPIHRFDARGDYSYGLYIYAFPLQQALAFLNVQTLGFTRFLACAFALTLLFAIASYRLVEAPFLRWKNVTPSWLIVSRLKKEALVSVRITRESGQANSN